MGSTLESSWRIELVSKRSPAVEDLADELARSQFVAEHNATVHNQSITIRAIDSGSGVTVGAMSADLAWGAVSIHRLVVSKGYRRGKGIGSALLIAALRKGQELGAQLATVETFEYQAPGFYPRHGFALDHLEAGWHKAGGFHYFSRPVATTEEFVAPSLSAGITLEELSSAAELQDFFVGVFTEHATGVLGESANSSAFTAIARAARESALDVDSSAADTPVLGDGAVAAASLTNVVGVCTGAQFWRGLALTAPVARRDAGADAARIEEALLSAAEEHAHASGFKLLAVDVFSFQNRAPFERLGYECTFSRPGYTHGVEMHHYVKAVGSAGGGSDRSTA
jgi:GNAT superfamily N-acetyltransferase